MADPTSGAPTQAPDAPAAPPAAPAVPERGAPAPASGSRPPADEGRSELSPDQLNRVLTLIRPRVWVVLAGLLVLVAVATVWGFVGRVQTTIGSQGVVVRGGGLVRVQAPVTGQIVTLRAAMGRHVGVGDVLAEVLTPDGARVPVVAHDAGTVVSLSAQSFAVVDRGALLAAIEPSGGTTDVVVFVPLRQRPELRVGQDVRVHINDVLASELGYVRGRVASIGAYPVGPGAIEQLVGTNALTSVLLGKQPMIEVQVALRTDRHTRSGFAWSSRAGGNLPVDGGQLVDGDIVVQSQSLVRMLFP